MSNQIQISMGNKVYCILKNKLKTILVYILILQVPFLLFGQEEFTSNKQILEYTDKLYGNEDILVNGKRYIHKNAREEGHPYYLSNRFENATVYIGDNIFKNVLLRYNIVYDEFVLNVRLKSGIPAYMMLNNLVDSTSYLGGVFIPASKLKIKGISKGYYEKIISGRFIFLTKYFKTSKIVYYRTKKYSEIYRTYSIFSNNELIKVNTKNAFVNYFNENKKDVKRYLRKNKIKYKTCNRDQLIGLIEYCNDL